MIDGLYSALQQHPSQTQPQPQQKILRMVKNERMGGSVPAWEKPQNDIESSLNQAANTETQSAPENALAYKAPDTQIDSTGAAAQEFGFGDLVDMVNPLHHIPVVGQIYRELSGDEIRPIGQIMGGALFGGPLGAASGLINVVIEEETGKDMTGNAMAFVLNSDTPQFRPRGDILNESPETRLAAIDPTIAQSPQPSQNDIPGNLLAFVDMKAQPEIVIERTSAADGRTAGSIARETYPTISENRIEAREPITQVRFNAYRTNN